MQDRDFSEIRSVINDKMTQVDCKAVLQQVTTAIEQNNFSVLPQYLADDVELHIYGIPAMSGSWKGRSAVVAAIESNFGLVTEQNPRVEGFLHDCSSSAVLLRETGRFRASGRRYEIRGVAWYTFEGSLIKRVDEFMTSVLLDS